jgi:cold shock CspA family protein
MTMSQMRSERAIVDWFNDFKGMGFATTTSAHRVFIHYSAIKSERTGHRTLCPTDDVEITYDVRGGEYYATEVRRILDKASR